MAKARSRLGSPPTRTTHGKQPAQNTSSFFTRYRKQLPTLIVGLLFWLIVGAIVFFFRPAQVEDAFVVASYAPLLIVVFLALFFTLAFLFLHTRRAFVAALLLVTFLFFQLQHVLFTAPLVAAILIFFVILEIGLTLIIYGLRTKKTSS